MYMLEFGDTMEVSTAYISDENGDTTVKGVAD